MESTSQPDPSSSRWLTTAEAARYTTISSAQLVVLRYRRKGPRYSKLGRRVVYDRSDLDAWLESQKTGGAAGDAA